MAIILVAPLVRNHSVTLLVLHVVWSTSRRSPVLEPAIDGPLAALLGRKASALQGCVLGVGVASDHVHIVVQQHPAITVAELVGRLKGASSREANVGGWYPSTIRWQVGYWAQSVSASKLEPLVRYLAGQRAHHAQAVAPEPWEQK